MLGEEKKDYLVYTNHNLYSNLVFLAIFLDKALPEVGNHRNWNHISCRARNYVMSTVK